MPRFRSTQTNTQSWVLFLLSWALPLFKYKRENISRLFLITPCSVILPALSSNMSKLLITGATPRPPPGGSFQRRKEIATFVRADNIREFSLYVQALRRHYISSPVDLPNLVTVQRSYIIDPRVKRTPRSPRPPRLWAGTPITGSEAFMACPTLIGTSHLVKAVATVSTEPLFSLLGTGLMS